MTPGPPRRKAYNDGEVGNHHRFKWAATLGFAFALDTSTGPPDLSTKAANQYVGTSFHSCLPQPAV